MDGLEVLLQVFGSTSSKKYVVTKDPWKRDLVDLSAGPSGTLRLLEVSRPGMPCRLHC